VDRDRYLQLSVETFKAHSLSDFGDNAPEFGFSPSDDYANAIGAAMQPPTAVLTCIKKGTSFFVNYT
jgi:hypothetical protein